MDEDSYHYRVIARAIALIEAAGDGLLPMETLARQVGLSPAHLQRVFTRWAGVSPMRYRQYLRLSAARQALADHGHVGSAAAAAGLSGTGRLHDMFITWEAMTPGRYAARGAGLTIAEAVCDTPFGPAVAMATDKGLCGLGFAAEIGVEASRADLAGRWPAARFVQDPARLAPLVAAAFGGGSPPLHVIGRPFQLQVWEALLAVPPGQVTQYAEIAARIDHATAARAVGTAVGRNPIGCVIPCHRVIRRDGAAGGYHWGLGVKRALLAQEAGLATAMSCQLAANDDATGVTR